MRKLFLASAILAMIASRTDRHATERRFQCPDRSVCAASAAADPATAGQAHP
jgi:hypothetical protein